MADMVAMGLVLEVTCLESSRSKGKVIQSYVYSTKKNL